MNYKIKRIINSILFVCLVGVLSTGCSSTSKAQREIKSYTCKPSKKTVNRANESAPKIKSSSEKAVRKKDYPPSKDYRIKRSRKKYVYPKR